VFANFTLIGPGPGVFAGVSPDKSAGATIRRGSGGTLVNGVIARWQGIGLNVQDAQTMQRLTDDSLFVSNVVFAANGSNFDPTGSNFGQKANFPNNDDLTTDPTTFFVGLPAAGATPTLASLDWTPSASSPLRSGGLTTFPAKVAARTQSFFGGAMPATSFRGAVDPSAGAKWWAGWTNYARN
jgi:hypothetical protein